MTGGTSASGCPVCRGADTPRFAELYGHAYLRCAACACVYLAAPERAPAAEGVYTADYIADRGHDAVGSSLTDAKEATARHYLALLEQHLSPGRLLEVGCSTGLALRVAAARGWQVHGVEVNRAAVDVANRVLGREAVVPGPLTADMFPGQQFDAVVLFDVIEHITTPDEFLDLLAPKVVPGGVVLLVTPNADSLSASLLRARWPHLMLEHVILYSLPALRALLARHALDVIRSGWAVKFANTELVRRHFACHPNSVGSRAVVAVMDRLRALERIQVPLNLGEMYVVARKR